MEEVARTAVAAVAMAEGVVATAEEKEKEAVTAWAVSVQDYVLSSGTCQN